MYNDCDCSTGGTCNCVDVDQTAYGVYGACNRTNFHYDSRCVRKRATWFSRQAPGDMPWPHGPWFQNVENAVANVGVCNNLYLGKDNLYRIPPHQKPLSVVITGPNGAKYEHVKTTGTRRDANGVVLDSWREDRATSEWDPATQTRTFHIQIKQPDREVVELHQFAPLTHGRGETTAAIIHNTCTIITTPGQAVDLEDTRFGVVGLDELRMVEVILFPEKVAVDHAAAHVFDAPPSTGDWTPQIVYVDPDGQPRPQGGVRWTSDGHGLTPGDACNLRVFMTSLADDTYYLYALDAEAGAWQYFKVVSTRNIPTVSEWGLIVLTLLGMTIGTVKHARRRRKRVGGAT